MTKSLDNRSDNGNFHFRGRERYYAVAGRQLDEKTNDGTDDYIKEKSKQEKTTIASIIAVGIVAVTLTSAVCLAFSSFVPVKLAAVKQPIVDDAADLFSDDSAIENEVKAFYNLTGIAPEVHTVYDEDWKDDYINLDVYAEYQQRGDILSDFVIVYSVPKNDAGSGSYKLSIIRGRNTKAILNGTLMNGFRKTIKNGIKQGSEPGEAFADAFRYATADAGKRMNPDTGTRTLMLILAFIPVIVVAAAFLIALVLTIRKYRKDRKAYA